MKMHSPGHSSADSIVASSWLPNHCESLGAAWVGVDLVAFLDVGQAIVEEGEDIGGNLFAETVAGAEILVDPNLHSALYLTLNARSLASSPTGPQCTGQRRAVVLANRVLFADQPPPRPSIFGGPHHRSADPVWSTSFVPKDAEHEEGPV